MANTETSNNAARGAGQIWPDDSAFAQRYYDEMTRRDAWPKGDAKIARWIDQDMNREIVVGFVLRFREINSGSGASFDCDRNGNVIEERIQPEGFKTLADSFRKLRAGTMTATVELMVSETDLCDYCDSGKEAVRRYDGRGIYITRCCDRCWEKKRRGYRPEILEHYTQADVDEPIEAEE